VTNPRCTVTRDFTLSDPQLLQSCFGWFRVTQGRRSCVAPTVGLTFGSPLGKREEALGVEGAAETVETVGRVLGVASPG
jgi:hypothetical protein